MRKPYSRYRSAPPVTVAMVTFNSGKFLRQAIESVLAQDFEDFELVISDDCSRDDSWEIANSFGDRRIRACRNEINVGEYRNRNRALALSRGKYLFFLDGDDILYPHGLGAMVRAMERFPGAAMASAIAPCEKFVFPLELAPREFYLSAFTGPNVLANDFTQIFFRADALKAHGGLDLRYRSGDTQIQLALGMRSSVVLIPNGMAWWRRRSGQASEAIRHNGESVKERWQYCIELLGDPACPLSAVEKRVARHNLTRLVLRHSLRLASRGQWEDAARIAFTTGFPIGEWTALLRNYDQSYLADVTGDDPVRAGRPPVAVPASLSRQEAVWQWKPERASISAASAGLASRHAARASQVASS